jgi:hypothetical protein
MTLLLEGKSMLLNKPIASSEKKLRSGKAGLRAD